MAKSKKKSEAAAPEKAVAPARVSGKTIVKVKNISGGIINTSKGMIESGETGEATMSELQSLNKFLEKA